MQCKGGFEHPEGENESTLAGSENCSGSQEPLNTIQTPSSDTWGPARSGHTFHPISHNSLSCPHQMELPSSSYVCPHVFTLFILIPLSWESLQTFLSFDGRGQILALPQVFVEKGPFPLSEFS